MCHPKDQLVFFEMYYFNFHLCFSLSFVKLKQIYEMQPITVFQ